jgi:hypothetical protein
MHKRDSAAGSYFSVEKFGTLGVILAIISYPSLICTEPKIGIIV